MKKMKRSTILIVAIVALAAVAAAGWFVRSCGRMSDIPVEVLAQAELLYGIEKGDYEVEEGVIASGQTLGVILARYGVGAAAVDRVARAAEPVFPVRNIRTGHNYTAFLRMDSDSTRRLEHFVYEQTLTDFVVISFLGDSVAVRNDHKEVTVQRKRGEGTISSSLWNCMIDGGMTPALAMDLSDIYAWSIDFFGLQPGDHFTVIYDEKYVDTTSVGMGRIWGAAFNHAGKTYYAIPFRQGEKITYWDEQGNSLRKNLLKAPLQYSRISSRFSGARMHPVLKIVRPHYGVDYAAPSGTPVVAVADGTVTFKGWNGDGGNMLKIRHSSGIESGYLHLRGFASGMAVGKRVSQGDLIGYVGMTGLATGPHLDYRLWMGGQPTDPLKVPTEPVEPITAENRSDFEMIKTLMLAELDGTIGNRPKVTQLDSLTLYRAVFASDSTATISGNP